MDEDDGQAVQFPQAAGSPRLVGDFRAPSRFFRTGPFLVFGTGGSIGWITQDEFVVMFRPAAKGTTAPPTDFQDGRHMVVAATEIFEANGELALNESEKAWAGL